MKKRKINVVVISDVHLGTTDCRAEELLAYLSSINPSKLILNGDILDIWKTPSSYFPSSHMKIVRKIFGMAAKGTDVYYIMGNHDDMLRKFRGKSVGNIHITNKLSLNLDGKKACFYHGDIFDNVLQNGKWMVKLGLYSYNGLNRVNALINRFLRKIGKERSFSKRISSGNENALKKLTFFEKTHVNLAIEKGYNFVICGHTHRPKKEIVMTKNGNCTYLNSGDWVKNLTALEYSFKRWKIYRYNYDKLSPFYVDEELKEMDIHEIINFYASRDDNELLDEGII